MHPIAWLLLTLSIAGVVPLPLAAQEPAPGFDLADRAPRFLAISAETAAPAVVDAGSVEVLRRRISPDLEDVTLEAALTAISREAGFRLMYSKAVVPLESRVRLQAKRITVAGALSEVLLDAGVDVLLMANGQVVLTKRAPVEAATTRVQAGTVSGRVTDAKSGHGLAAAEVYLEGTRWRTRTGEDGRYRLAEVEAESYTLAVRRIGYAKRSQAVTVAADEEVTVDIALEPVPTQLNEIVTTVTGDQRRVELGHVVGRINADSVVKEAPVSSLSELLTSRVPGLQVFQTQGTVGGRTVLRVRGPNSLLLNNQPIVVVDGVRYTTEERRALFGNGGPGDVEPSSPLNDINVNDIESIEVVKGPSAATLYGTDAANGVIVVTTKRGQPGPARWTAYAKGTTTSIPKQEFANTYWGWGTVFGVPNNPDVSCNLQALAAGWCTQQDSITVLRNPLNDAEQTIFGSKPRWEYGMNVAGGRQDLRYYFSGDYEDATGPIQMPRAIAEELMEARGLSELPEEWSEPNGSTKLNLRSNVMAKLGETADLRVSTGYVKTNTRTLPRFWSPYTASYFGSPAQDPYTSGPHSPAQAFAQTTNEHTDRFMGSASGEWRPVPWLSTRAVLGLDFTGTRLYGLVRPGDQPGGFSSSDGAAEDSRAEQVTTTAELGAAVTARRGRLSARTALGAQYVRTLYTASGAFGQGLPPGGSVVQNARTIQTAQQHRETVLLGGYLEEMLGLNERLFLTGAVRVDGASTFGRDYDAAVHPKVGASWLVSEEPFLPRLPGLDELRLRYAFGTSGQQPDPAMARPLLFAGSMQLNGQTVSKVDVGTLGNPDLRPERVQEHEFGFDVGALGRVTLEATWFRRRTVDQLVIQSGAPGQGSLTVNLGLTTQRGFEAQLRGRVVDARWLNWDLALSHSDYSTLLRDLGDGFEFSDMAGGWVEGYPIGIRSQNPVVVGWEDRNGDGIIAREEVVLDGPVYYGESIPPRSQTLTSVVGLFEGRLRVSALLERKSGFTQINQLSFTGRATVDPSTPLAEQVRAQAFQGVVPEKGDFTRLREVAVALDLPMSLVRALRLSRGTFVVSARNLALWTDFSGPDPEVDAVGNGTANVSGGQALGIPQGRGFSFRLDVGL